MSLGQILLILWRRSWIIAPAFLTTLAVAIGVLLLTPGRYEAVATASIDPRGLDPVGGAGSAGAASIGLMQGNMVQLVLSRRVAVDVVNRLGLTANPQTQDEYRKSDAFGREPINDWMASSILPNVDPKFWMGNVLSIKYKSGSPSQAALVANAFLVSTIDATIAMRAASGEQTARWFDPQIASMRKELETARAALEDYQNQANLVSPTSSPADTKSSALMAIGGEVTSNKALLTILKTRLDSGSTSLESDPSDPDLQLLAGLKDKLLALQSSVEVARNAMGVNNPRMVAGAANIAALQKQIAEATDRSRQRLKDRIANTEAQVAELEVARADARRTLIAAQAQRSRLSELQQDVSFRLEQLNQQEKMAEEAKLQSKLTFADISVLDKAVPPLSPSFPKPFVVIPVGVAAGLALGLILGLIAEMTDRRIRVPRDLQFASAAPLLGVIEASRRFRSSDLRFARKLSASYQ